MTGTLFRTGGLSTTRIGAFATNTTLACAGVGRLLMTTTLVMTNRFVAVGVCTFTTGCALILASVWRNHALTLILANGLGTTGVGAFVAFDTLVGTNVRAIATKHCK